mgnify:CR=1 FL=1
MTVNPYRHDKLLLHLSSDLRRVVDPAGVYYMEAVGGDTLLRRRDRAPIKDVRRLGEIIKVWRNRGFVHIHRNHAVNL